MGTRTGKNRRSATQSLRGRDLRSFYPLVNLSVDSLGYSWAVLLEHAFGLEIRLRVFGLTDPPAIQLEGRSDEEAHKALSTASAY